MTQDVAANMLVYTLNSFGIEGLISKREAAVTRW